MAQSPVKDPPHWRLEGQVCADCCSTVSLGRLERCEAEEDR